MGIFKKMFQKQSKNKILRQSAEDLKNAETFDDVNKIAKILIENEILTKDNMFADDLEHLDANGELPFGWFTAHPDATEKEKPLKVLINNYVIYQEQKAPIDTQLDNLKKLVDYFTEFRDYCYGKDECYIKFFSSSYEHCHNSQCDDFSLLESYKSRLQEMIDNYDNLVHHEQLVKTLSDELLQFIKNNNEILQKDIYHSFDECLKDDIQSLLYQWEKDNIIIREKKGNTYTISTK